MLLTPTYAKRSDLSWYEKHRYSFEERMCASKLVRTLYYRYHALPRVIQGFFGTIFVVTMLVSLMFLIILQTVAEKVTGVDDISDTGIGATTFWLYVLGVLAALCFLHPMSWILVGCLAWFFFWLWFIVAIDDSKNFHRALPAA